MNLITCTGIGLSRSMPERTLAISSGVARLPRMVLAASPGTMFTRSARSTMTTSSTNTVMSRRLRK